MRKLYKDSISSIYYLDDNQLSPGEYYIDYQDGDSKVTIKNISSGRLILPLIEITNIYKEDNTPYTNVTEFKEVVKDLLSINTNSEIRINNTAISEYNPLPINQDSIFENDIDWENSDFTNWLGDPKLLFRSPFSASIVNSTLDNPKQIIIAFKRTVSAVQIGFGENNSGNFSNLKVSLLGSSGIQRSLYDISSNNSKLNSLNIVIGDTLFNSILIEFYTTDTISLSNLTIAKAQFGVIQNEVNNPVVTDGDSVYNKDIDLAKSNLYNFTGSITDLFNDLHSENSNTTSENPKTLLVHFKRTIISSIIGIGSSLGGNFSNVKLTAILSGEVELVLYDFSYDNTKKTTQTLVFPVSGINALKLEFYTSDPVSISHLFINKTQSVLSISQSPIVYPSSYKSPYLLNMGSQDMNVNGSVTPIDFIYQVEGTSPTYWHRSFIDLRDGNNAFYPDDFGEIATGLINGVDIIIEKDGVEFLLENWKTNMDISMSCYDFTPPYITGAYIGRWTISSDLGSPLTLFSGDKIICRINDNLTGLTKFRFRVKLKQ